MNDFVAPAYGDRSLGDVMPAVARAVGRPIDDGDAGGAWQLPSAPAYVVFLVDGLGQLQLEAHQEEAPFLHGLLTGAVGGSIGGTAGVPSTTATSLTSLGTGLPPGVHGVVGFSSRIPGTDELLYALAWSKEVDPHEWQPHPTAFTRMASAGIAVTAVNKREFKGSGLTEASSRGAEFVGADRLGERFVAVQAATRVPQSVTYMYEGDLDWTGHRYGVDSAQWRAQLSMIDMAAQRFREELPEQVRIVVVADHGMVDATHQVDVDQIDGMRDGIALIGGEARLRYLYCANGAVEDVAARWREELGRDAEVLLRDEAVARGWFGEVDATVLPRLGDVVVAARGETVVLSTRDNPYEARLIGMHGSLTPEEMLIPILIA
jgi:hypothetical protein